MNERIKELIERAEYQAKKQCYEDWEVYVPPSREQILEKFAELIVRECAKNAVLFADSTTTQGLPSRYIENYMLKHFGV